MQAAAAARPNSVLDVCGCDADLLYKSCSVLPYIQHARRVRADLVRLLSRSSILKIQSEWNELGSSQGSVFVYPRDFSTQTQTDCVKVGVLPLPRWVIVRT